MNAFHSLSRQTWFVVTTGLILILLIGVLDHLTGEQMSLSIFYVLPITWITWFTNRRNGVIAAVFSATVWLMLALASRNSNSFPLLSYWNAGLKLTFFLLIVFLESNLKTMNEDLEGRIAERTERLAAEMAERKRAEQRLQKYTERLKILHEIDQAILSAQSLEATAHIVERYLVKLIPCEHASIALNDSQSHPVVVFDATSDEATGLRAHETITLHKLGENEDDLLQYWRGKIRLIDDLNDSSTQRLTNGTPLVNGYRSLLNVPIMAHDESLGTIHLHARRPNAFTPDHVEIACGVAHQLGIEIQRVNLLNQLRASREDLQALSQRLLEVQENERRQIARELHDEIGQELTGLGYMLEMATRLPVNAVQKLLQQSHVLVVDLMERVSQLSLELRPALLDDLGLLPTLLWYFDRYSSQTGVNANLKHKSLEGTRFAPEVETVAYRIVQEALTNVVRHASVSEVCVTLWVDQSILGILIEDQGNGFDPEMALSSGNSSGLAGMRERALLLGGKLTLESRPGFGTRILAELPVSRPVGSDQESQVGHNRTGR